MKNLIAFARYVVYSGDNSVLLKAKNEAEKAAAKGNSLQKMFVGELLHAFKGYLNPVSKENEA